MRADEVRHCFFNLMASVYRVKSHMFVRVERGEAAPHVKTILTDIWKVLLAWQNAHRINIDWQAVAIDIAVDQQLAGRVWHQ